MPTNNGGRRSVTPMVVTGFSLPLPLSLSFSLPFIDDERTRNRSDSC